MFGGTGAEMISRLDQLEQLMRQEQGYVRDSLERLSDAIEALSSQVSQSQMTHPNGTHHSPHAPQPPNGLLPVATMPQLPANTGSPHNIPTSPFGAFATMGNDVPIPPRTGSPQTGAKEIVQIPPLAVPTIKNTLPSKPSLSRTPKEERGPSFLFDTQSRASSANTGMFLGTCANQALPSKPPTPPPADMAVVQLNSPSTNMLSPNQESPTKEDKRVSHRSIQTPGRKKEQSNSVTFLFGHDEKPPLLMPNTYYRYIIHFMLTCCACIDYSDLVMSSSDSGWWAPGSDLVEERPMLWGYFLYGAVECVLATTEVFLNARTAVLVGWTLIDDDPRKVFLRYLRGWFAFDVIVALPIDLFLFMLPGVTPFRWARCVKSLRLFRIPGFFPGISPITDVPKAITGFRFAVYCLIVIITLSFAWVEISTEEEANAGGALSGSDRFTMAVYYIVTTLTSVGYGDVSPVHTGAQWYSMFVQVLGVVFLVWAGAVGTAFILESDPRKVAIADRKRRLASLMEANKIPLWLQKQCFVILPTVLDSNLRDYKVILNEMPPFMQDRITKCIKAQLIKGVPLFRGASPHVLNALVESLRSRIVPPREYIIEHGERGNEMFFLSTGTVEVTIPGPAGQSERWVATLSEGSWFGEVALLCETERTANIRAVSPCVVLVLEKSAFLDIVRSDKDFEATLRKELSRRGLGQNDSSSSSDVQRASDGASNYIYDVTDDLANGTPASERSKDLKIIDLDRAGAAVAAASPPGAGYSPRLNVTRPSHVSGVESFVSRFDSSRRSQPISHPRSSESSAVFGEHAWPLAVTDASKDEAGSEDDARSDGSARSPGPGTGGVGISIGRPSTVSGLHAHPTRRPNRLGMNRPNLANVPSRLDVGRNEYEQALPTRKRGTVHVDRIEGLNLNNWSLASANAKPEQDGENPGTSTIEEPGSVTQPPLDGGPRFQGLAKSPSKLSMWGPPVPQSPRVGSRMGNPRLPKSPRQYGLRVQAAK
eukprot:Hpha_TRINITY_DN29870_c0_g1::TRINITY_DN29870_c0_g1_i1::g.2938::m.2938